MTYPPGGSGGDPTGHRQQPQEPDPAWWDHPAPATGSEYQVQQPGWTGSLPVEGQGWQPTQTNWPAQQGYPQDTGYGQQPGYAQHTGQGQQPGLPQDPGYPQQQGFSQPPKSNTGLIIGVVAGLVVMLAIAVGAIVLVSKDDKSSQADATTTTTTTEATSAPATTRTAPTTTKPAAGGSRFHYTEYGKDWDFKFGDVELHAKYVTGRDFDTCAQIDKAGTLTGLGCQVASEMAWKAEGGELMLTQIVMTMSDSGQADAAYGQFDNKDVKLSDGTYIADFETGKWKAATLGKFVVYTVATATSSVDEATVDKYLSWRSKDTVAALGFR
ncbi:hypothetical protein [Nocardia seriolae]|uniref:Uncharacterized protein n=1 Tax=Nocardia seriolae TaxID=37332 RepID=A0ABC9YXB6_9NOCA|nr:hypothetical protein [Nocardia seriolae]GAM48019.1 hypothetical protein NS07_v2contig00063-0016 [Nocardia seriolae]GAP29926.1 hypothetical protein NSK11_contig00068-0016 [Nocardia seriolae]